MKNISYLFVSVCLISILSNCSSGKQQEAIAASIERLYYSRDLPGVISLAEKKDTGKITSFNTLFLIAKSYFFLVKDNQEYSSKAENLLLELIEKEPHFSEGRIFLARHYYYHGNNSEKTIAALKEVLQYEPDNFKANAMLFKVFSSAGNQAAAKTAAGYLMLYEKDIAEAQMFLKAGQ